MTQVETCDHTSGRRDRHQHFKPKCKGLFIVNNFIKLSYHLMKLRHKFHCGQNTVNKFVFPSMTDNLDLDLVCKWYKSTVNFLSLKKLIEFSYNLIKLRQKLI